MLHRRILSILLLLGMCWTLTASAQNTIESIRKTYQSVKEGIALMSEDFPSDGPMNCVCGSTANDCCALMPRSSIRHWHIPILIRWSRVPLRMNTRVKPFLRSSTMRWTDASRVPKTNLSCLRPLTTDKERIIYFALNFFLLTASRIKKIWILMS